MKKFTVLIALLCLVISGLIWLHADNMEFGVTIDYQLTTRVYASNKTQHSRCILKSVHLPEKLITILDNDNNYLLCRVADNDIDELIMFNAHLPNIEWRLNLLECCSVNRDDIKAVMIDSYVYMSVSDKIICIEKDTGKCLWESHIAYPRHESSNMVMYKGRIYIPSRQYLLCYDRNALLKWKIVYPNYDDDPDMDLSIQIFDESLFVKKGGCVYRMDPSTGRNIWEYHGKYDAFSNNIVISDRYVIVDANLFQYVYLDIETGKVVRDNTGQFSLYKPLLIDDWRLYHQ